MNNTPKSRAVWLRHSVAASSLAPHTVPAKVRRSLRMRIDYLLGLRAVVMPFAVNPPAFKLWTEEMTQGVQTGGQLHALLLVGSSAKALVDSIYGPEWLREPFTRRQTYAMYSESLWSNLPKDVHMMIVSVENVEALAKPSPCAKSAFAAVSVCERDALRAAAW